MEVTENTNELDETNLLKEAVEQARKVFYFLVSFIAYVLITVFTSNDRQLVLNQTTKLPFFNSDVAFNVFFLISPILLLILYVNFLNQVYKIIRITKQSAKKYPWFMTTQTYSDTNRDIIEKIQNFLNTISLFYLVPITLTFLTVFYLKKHEPVLSFVMCFFPLGGYLLSFHLRAIFKGWTNEAVVSFRTQWILLIPILCLITLLTPFDSLIDFSSYIFIGFRFLIVLILVDVCLVILYVFVKRIRRSLLRNSFLKVFLLVNYFLLIPITFLPLTFNMPFQSGSPYRQSVVWFLCFFVLFVLVIVYQNIEKRENYKIFSKISLNIGLIFFSEIILIFLSYNTSSSSTPLPIFVIDLSYQSLSGENKKDNVSNALIDLNKIKLQSADMSYAILNYAQLRGSDLTEAHFNGTIIKFSDFSNANLLNTDFSYAKLEKSIFFEANFDGTNFFKADLQGANFSYNGINSNEEHKSNINHTVFASFEKANLTGATFSGAGLKGASFKDAILDSVDFSDCDLTEARDLTSEQLLKTRSLKNAILDSIIGKAVIEKNPGSVFMENDFDYRDFLSGLKKNYQIGQKISLRELKKLTLNLTNYNRSTDNSWLQREGRDFQFTLILKKMLSDLVLIKVDFNSGDAQLFIFNKLPQNFETIY